MNLSLIFLIFFQTYNTNEELKTFYKVLSTNTDGKIEFVSTVEGSYNAASLTNSHSKFTEGICINECFLFPFLFSAYDYPIYGTQWHPEKNAFEWTKPYIPHSPSAVRTTFYMAEFFVSEGMNTALIFAPLIE